MLKNLDDDGLFLHTIKAHSLEKIERHDYYASIFARAMRNKFPRRVYVGLYSGPGRARIEGSGEVVETSALGSLRAPFTDYIFADRDPEATKALSARAASLSAGRRVEILTVDVNESAAAVKSAIPPHGPGRGVITFCFVDPYSAAFKFDVIRELAAGNRKIDFLILLMIGRDIRTNLQRYLQDEDQARIGDLLDDPNWRDEYQSSGEGKIVPFILKKFDTAMQGLGYLECTGALVHQVKIPVKNVFLYSLVLYSRDKLGQQFWRETLRGTNPQLGMFD